MRINLNRTGEFPDESYLREKLNLSTSDFNELIIDAKESGLDVRNEFFELHQYSKIDKNEIQFGTEEKEPFGFNDFISYKNDLLKQIIELDFNDDTTTENILEISGTIVNYLESLINRIAHESFFDNKHNDHVERNYEEVMTVHGKQKVILTTNQLEISIDKFLQPFESIFDRIGMIFEAYDTRDEKSYNEQDLIRELKDLNFKEIESFLKLYEDGELD